MNPVTNTSTVKPAPVRQAPTPAPASTPAGPADRLKLTTTATKPVLAAVPKTLAQKIAIAVGVPALTTAALTSAGLAIGWYASALGGNSILLGSSIMIGVPVVLGLIGLVGGIKTARDLLK